VDLSIEELARDAIERHRALKLAEANEAETRIKLIDVILYRLLGWSHDDISLEERTDAQDGSIKYCDYIVRTGNTSFVIEAKKIGRTFSHVSSKRRIKLTRSELTGDLGEAVNQTRQYCIDKNIPFGVTTNGAQWVIFPAVRIDGVSFASSSAVVFDSIESSLGTDFNEFRDLLSREAVVNGSLEQHLLGRNRDQIEARRLKVYFTSGTRPSNPLLPLIEEAITASFTDSFIDKDDELLQRAYVQTAERARFDTRIQMHLSKQDPLFSSAPARPMRRKDSKSLVNKLDRSNAKALPVAIFVLGQVGAGKTTFLKYTRRITAADFFRERNDQAYPHWIYIDFRGFSPGDSPFDFLYASIFEYVKRDSYFSEYNRAIRSAYSDEIEALKRGPMALLATNQEAFDTKVTEIMAKDYTDVRPYVDKLLTYASTKVPVFLVIDNVDQIEDEQVQARIFSDGMALAVKLGTNIVLTMRESTFVNHRHSSLFDAFDFDPVVIEHPDIQAVLARRLNIARQLLSGKRGEFRAENGALIRLDDLGMFFEIVQKSLLGTAVGSRIGVLANGDVRMALRLTRQFLERGYSDPGKAIEFYKNDNTYTLPPHEAFRAILIGNEVVYDEDRAAVANPFDSRLSKTSDQMLRLFILAALVRMSSEASFRNLPAKGIFKSIRTIGFPDEHVMSVLSDLCRYRFLYTSSHAPPDLSSSFYPSKLGGYVVRELVGDFTFVENVMMDTFIADETVWSKLSDLTESIQNERKIVERIKLRVDRNKEFYRYLMSLYEPLNEDAVRRGLSAEWCTNPLNERKKDFNRNCQRVLASAKRLYGSGR
jgi:hypothetical protein